MSTPEPKPSETPEPEPESNSTPSSSSSSSSAVTTPVKSLLRDIQHKADDFVESRVLRDATSSQEFLTQNTLKLIGKTYVFILVVLGMFIVVAILRESIVQDILPVITLIVGGVLGFLSKDILRGNDGNNNST